MVRLTKAKRLYFMRDERKAVREYRKYGLFGLARDESRHYYYLKRRKV